MTKQTVQLRTRQIHKTRRQASGLYLLIQIWARGWQVRNHWPSFFFSQRNGCRYVLSAWVGWEPICGRLKAKCWLMCFWCKTKSHRDYTFLCFWILGWTHFFDHNPFLLSMKTYEFAMPKGHTYCFMNFTNHTLGLLYHIHGMRLGQQPVC